VALVMGDISGETGAGTRTQRMPDRDAFGSLCCDCGEQKLDMAMKEIAKEGRGVLLYMRRKAGE